MPLLRIRTDFLTIRFYILKTIAVDASIVEEEEEGEEETPLLLVAAKE